MPLYEFQCSNQECRHSFEETFSIRDTLPTCCGYCEQHTLAVVLSPPTIIDRTPRTIGTQAERNSNSTRQYWLDAKRRESEEARLRGVEELNKNLPDGVTSGRIAKTETPFWRDSPKIERGLNNLNPAQKRNYILTGKPHE